MSVDVSAGGGKCVIGGHGVGNKDDEPFWQLQSFVEKPGHRSSYQEQVKRGGKGWALKSSTRSFTY